MKEASLDEVFNMRLFDAGSIMDNDNHSIGLEVITGEPKFDIKRSHVWKSFSIKETRLFVIGCLIYHLTNYHS